MYNIYHKIIEAIFMTLFYHIYDHYTRTASHLYVLLAGTNLSKFGIRYQVIMIWNKTLIVNINPGSSELSSKAVLQKLSTSNW